MKVEVGATKIFISNTKIPPVTLINHSDATSYATYKKKHEFSDFFQIINLANIKKLKHFFFTRFHYNILYLRFVVLILG